MMGIAEWIATLNFLRLQSMLLRDGEQPASYFHLTVSLKGGTMLKVTISDDQGNVNTILEGRYDGDDLYWYNTTEEMTLGSTFQVFGNAMNDMRCLIDDAIIWETRPNVH